MDETTERTDDDPERWRTYCLAPPGTEDTFALDRDRIAEINDRVIRLDALAAGGMQGTLATEDVFYLLAAVAAAYGRGVLWKQGGSR